MCDLWDIGCNTSNVAIEIADKAVQGTLTSMTEGLKLMFGQLVAATGTFWITAPKPEVQGGSVPVEPANVAGAADLQQLLGWVKWGCLGLAVISLIVLGATWARRREAGEGLGKLGTILIGTALIGSAGTVVTMLSPQRDGSASDTVGFVQDQVWWYTLAALVVSVMIGGAKMIIEQRSQPGIELLKSLGRFVLVCGAGLTVIAMAVNAGDAYSKSVLSASMNCPGQVDGKCFGEAVFTAMALTGPQNALVMMLIMLFIAALISMCQLILLIARNGIIIIFAGLLNISAAATNTETGRNMWRKVVAWLVAFVLYKPVAATIYAATFRLFSTPGQNPVVSFATGLVMMIVALLAMPALVKVIMPMAGMGGGAAAGLALGAAAALPTGAVEVARRFSRHTTSDSSGGGGTAEGAGPTPATQQSAPPPDGSTQAGGTHRVPGGAPAGQELSASGPSSGAASAGGQGASTAGASGAATGASGGGVAAGVGAVAAPVAAAEVAVGAVKKGVSAAQELGEESAGVPNGSN